MWGCVLTALAGLVLAPLMGSGSLPLVGLFLSIALLLIAVAALVALVAVVSIGESLLTIFSRIP
jgi:hypothetical protein